MSRNPFGWSLPPGVTDRMIDEAAGALDDDFSDMPEEPPENDGEFDEPVDHQAARWDHQRDLRKHES